MLLMIMPTTEVLHFPPILSIATTIHTTACSLSSLGISLSLYRKLSATSLKSSEPPLMRGHMTTL